MNITEDGEIIGGVETEVSRQTHGHTTQQIGISRKGPAGEISSKKKKSHSREDIGGFSGVFPGCKGVTPKGGPRLEGRGRGPMGSGLEGKTKHQGKFENSWLA